MHTLKCDERHYVLKTKADVVASVAGICLWPNKYLLLVILLLLWLLVKIGADGDTNFPQHAATSERTSPQLHDDNEADINILQEVCTLWPQGQHVVHQFDLVQEISTVSRDACSAGQRELNGRNFMQVMAEMHLGHVSEASSMLHTTHSRVSDAEVASLPMAPLAELAELAMIPATSNTPLTPTHTDSNPEELNTTEQANVNSFGQTQDGSTLDRFAHSKKPQSAAIAMMQPLVPGQAANGLHKAVDSEAPDSANGIAADTLAVFRISSKTALNDPTVANGDTVHPAAEVAKGTRADALVARYFPQYLYRKRASLRRYLFGTTQSSSTLLSMAAVSLYDAPVVILICCVLIGVVAFAICSIKQSVSDDGMRPSRPGEAMPRTGVKAHERKDATSSRAGTAPRPRSDLPVTHLPPNARAGRAPGLGRGVPPSHEPGASSHQGSVADEIIINDSCSIAASMDGPGGMPTHKPSGRELCPMLVVPQGHDCVLAVPQASIGSLLIRDLTGKPLIRAEVMPDVSESTATIKLLPEELASAARDTFAFCRIVKDSRVGESSVKIYAANDLFFAHLSPLTTKSQLQTLWVHNEKQFTLEPGRPCYLLSGSYFGPKLLFGRHAQNDELHVVNENSETLASTEPSSTSYDDHKCYLVRVVSGVDVGLILCGILSIWSLESK